LNFLVIAAALGFTKKTGPCGLFFRGFGSYFGIFLAPPPPPPPKKLGREYATRVVLRTYAERKLLSYIRLYFIFV
ncbi:hypothetical protein QCD77_22985, partial [Pseudomonas savastanoi pv. phaseolicola]|nr:hypothetical protein [Pseudomonas savastanoi pv. phaseolicola]